MGISILTERSNDYAVRPFLISGTCLRETVTQHHDMLQVVLSAVRDPGSPVPRSVRIYVVSTDGCSLRRRVLIIICMSHTLSPSSPIYPALSPLTLFILLHGIDEITNDPDWKHVLKRLRNTLLRQAGITIANVSISTSVIKTHLVKNGMTSSAAERLLAPNDRQDVVLMIQLLNAISLLPASDDTLPISSRPSRRILCLLGRLYRYLLEAYLDTSLSLDEQLIRLAAASRIALALYHSDRGRFMPVQLYFDLQCMIRTVYFCIAKAQVDDPDGRFFIILLGTDGLEKIFGKVRTMIGNDTNADLLQLSNRIDGAVQCVKILEEHPEWGGQARRLNLKTLAQKGEQISRDMDHVAPRSLSGDTHYRNTVLFSCQRIGEEWAERDIRKAELEAPFDYMKQTGGFADLCPLGGGKVILKDGRISEDEQEEEEEEVAGASTDSTTNGNTSDEATSALELDDLAAVEAFRDTETGRPKYEPRISVNEDDTDGTHKATILRVYSSPFAVALSHDRLKRVRDTSQYDEPRLPPSVIAALSQAHGDVVVVEDPIITLLRCDDHIFVAVVAISQIFYNGTSVSRIPSSHARQPNVRFRARIMKLVTTDDSYQPLGPDWQWDGGYETGHDLNDLDGTLVELVDPETEAGAYTGSDGLDTFCFRSDELRAIGALLFSRTIDLRHRIRIVSRSDTFPYRLSNGVFSLFDGLFLDLMKPFISTGAACFLCESDGAEYVSKKHGICYRCEDKYTEGLAGPRILDHQGSHILFDPVCKRLQYHLWSVSRYRLVLRDIPPEITQVRPPT